MNRSTATLLPLATFAMIVAGCTTPKSDKSDSAAMADTSTGTVAPAAPAPPAPATTATTTTPTTGAAVAAAGSPPAVTTAVGTIKKINLNTATDAEILAIPGMGPRMLREFKEYRPYTSIEQFRREIGKYVDKAEVARLEQYVYIK